MILRIEGCNDVMFIKYLIKYLRKYIISSIQPKKLIKLNNYLNSLPSLVNGLRKSISCREIIYLGAYNIIYRKYEDYYEIIINPTVKLFGTDAKLSDLCKLINYGTMSTQGYPIFSDAFGYVSANIRYLHLVYKEGLNI